jgi:hypothetical protein
MTWRPNLRAVEAQDANTLASVEDRRGIALSLLAELAQDYLQLRGVQAQLDIAERNEQVAARNTVLVVNQFGNGVATTLDMAQARSQQATIAASIPPLRIQRAALINAIGLLLAEQPRALEAELKPRAGAPEVPLLVPVGLPSELVRRRPDVREAEARLHAATAATGVAVASFYPDIALNGVADLNGLGVCQCVQPAVRGLSGWPDTFHSVIRGGKAHRPVAAAEIGAAGSGDRLPEDSAARLAGGGRRPDGICRGAAAAYPNRRGEAAKRRGPAGRPAAL